MGHPHFLLDSEYVRRRSSNVTVWWPAFPSLFIHTSIKQAPQDTSHLCTPTAEFAASTVTFPSPSFTIVSVYVSPSGRSDSRCIFALRQQLSGGLLISGWMVCWFGSQGVPCPTCTLWWRRGTRCFPTTNPWDLRRCRSSSCTPPKTWVLSLLVGVFHWIPKVKKS